MKVHNSPVLFFILAFLMNFIGLTNGINQNDGSSVLRDIPLRNHFTSSDYNGGIQSWCFDQDSSGILYIANNYGLLEFDGNRWTLFDVPFCTKVRAVKVDNKNRIFVGGQGQIGYFTMSDKGLVFSSLLEKLPADMRNIAETWKILEQDGKVYFNTESQLFVLDGESLKVLSLPGYLRQISSTGNRFLAQFANMGLFELVNENFISIPETANLPDLISILPHAGDYYYFSYLGDVFKHDDSGVHPVEFPFTLGTINDVIKLRSGDYAIGTQNNGLYLLNSDLSFKLHLTKNEGLSDRTIKSLYEDHFNNLWVALNNGIDYLQLSLPFSLINEEVGLEGTGYAACMHDGKVYLGTNNGLFVQKKTGSGSFNSQYEIVQGSEGQTYNFSSVEGDLILNHDKGAFLIEDFDLTQFHDMGSWKFVETPLPGLIFGGDYQGMAFFRKINGKWTKVRGIDGFVESSRMIEFENDSILWMTHGSKGAYRLIFDKDMNLKGNIEHFGKEEGFPSNLNINVYPLIEKLVFTAESGIYNYNHASNSFITNSFFNKWMGTNHVSEIVSNGSNKIYYIQDQMMGIITQETFGTYVKETGLFKHINQLLNDDLPNISILDDQNVLIGAKEGFIRYEPRSDFLMNRNFYVLLKSVEIGTSVDSSVIYNPSFIVDKEIVRNQSIKFQYTAPYFDGFEATKYSYRLIPFDDNWSEWLPASEKEYPYLPSGDYTFEVKALNVYDLESSVSSFSFNVSKPWYLSNWAIFIYFISGVILVLLILLIQRRKFRTEKSMINKDKEEALKSKNEEINQISEDSKKEIDRLLNEKLRTEIDLKNDRLTTITMLFMNKNEFIQDVRKRIETYLNQGGSKQELKRLIKTIDENLSDNDSWDQFAYHFDQVHGDYLKKLSDSNVKLSPREIKLAAFLRMNMSSKEISNLLNITPRSVELARYRLRKKLKLDRDQNLVEYLIELDS